MSIQRIIIPLLAGTALLLLTGCDEDKYKLKFSHHLHVTENEMACEDCHGELGQPSFTQLSHESCSDCHDETADKEIKPATCGICHEGKLGEILREAKAEPAAAAPTSVFVHTQALAGRCQECHSEIMPEGLTSVPLLSRNDILNIRNKAHSSNQDCSSCHVEMDPYQAPADHSQFWMKRHGMFGRQDDAACSVCHSKDSCAECHSVMKPVSHNNLFRLHTHGTIASWNRESCMVCHQQDSCTACHSQARPRSHNARWAAPGKRPTHCIGCHTAAGPGEGCVVCHQDGNNIQLHESFWPAGHNRFGAGISCYECHWTNNTP